MKEPTNGRRIRKFFLIFRTMFDKRIHLHFFEYAIWKVINRDQPDKAGRPGWQFWYYSLDGHGAFSYSRLQLALTIIDGKIESFEDAVKRLHEENYLPWLSATNKGSLSNDAAPSADASAKADSGVSVLNGTSIQSVDTSS